MCVLNPLFVQRFGMLPCTRIISVCFAIKSKDYGVLGPDAFASNQHLLSMDNKNRLRDHLLDILECTHIHAHRCTHTHITYNPSVHGAGDNNPFCKALSLTATQSSVLIP